MSAVLCNSLIMSVAPKGGNVHADKNAIKFGSSHFYT